MWRPLETPPVTDTTIIGSRELILFPKTESDKRHAPKPASPYLVPKRHARLTPTEALTGPNLSSPAFSCDTRLSVHPCLFLVARRDTYATSRLHLLFIIHAACASSSHFAAQVCSSGRTTSLSFHQWLLACSPADAREGERSIVRLAYPTDCVIRSCVALTTNVPTTPATCARSSCLHEQNRVEGGGPGSRVSTRRLVELNPLAALRYIAFHSARRTYQSAWIAVDRSMILKLWGNKRYDRTDYARL